MANVTRRRALAGFSGVALGSVVASPAGAADAAPEGVPLVFGPFNIDAWFLKVVKSSPLGGPLAPLTTPKHEDVAKVLAECRVYILDRRVGPAGKEGRFADGYPIVAAGGKLAGKWQDGEKSYALHVAEVSVNGTHTASERGLEYREVGRVTVSIHLRGSDAKESADAVYHFSSERPSVAYDITGALRKG